MCTSWLSNIPWLVPAPGPLSRLRRRATSNAMMPSPVSNAESPRADRTAVKIGGSLTNSTSPTLPADFVARANRLAERADRKCDSLTLEAVRPAPETSKLRWYLIPRPGGVSGSRLTAD